MQWSVHSMTGTSVGASTWNYHVRMFVPNFAMQVTVPEKALGFFVVLTGTIFLVGYRPLLV